MLTDKEIRALTRAADLIPEWDTDRDVLRNLLKQQALAILHQPAGGQAQQARSVSPEQYAEEFGVSSSDQVVPITSQAQQTRTGKPVMHADQALTAQQVPVTCGNGCACLTECGDTYDYQGKPKPPKLQDADKVAGTLINEGTKAEQFSDYGRAGEMTPRRAIYFLERFKRDEKMLGPNEQWALEYSIAELEAVRPDPAMAGDAVTRFKVAFHAAANRGEAYDQSISEGLAAVHPASGEDAAHYLATHGVNIRQAFRAVMDHVCIDQEGDALYWQHEINALDAAMQQEPQP